MGICIAAAVILLVIALLFTRIILLFQFSGGDITVAVKILFFRIDITEKAEEKINKKQYKIKRFRRRRDKVLKKYRIKEESKNKKKKADSPKENAENQENAETSAPAKKKKNPKQLINMVKELFGEVFKVFPKYLHIEFKRFTIGVGGKDAADIALKTGALMQALQYLITSLQKVANVRKTKDGQVGVYPMFVEGKWCAEADISAYIRVGNVLRIGIIFIKNYIKHKLKKKK